jgi:PAS domain S-box-containing protein
MNGSTERDESMGNLQKDKGCVRGQNRNMPPAALNPSEPSTPSADAERTAKRRSHVHDRTWHVSPDLLGVLNAQGHFESSNPAWQVVLGWSEQEVASTSIFELLHPDDLERTRAGFDLTQQGQPAIRFPNRYRHKDGSYRWISWVAVPEGDVVFCSGRDITDERKQTEALAHAQEALRQSQKMEAIGHLSGGIAHDFNNLLQVISVNLQLIGKLAAGNEAIEKRVAGALGAVQRGARLSSQMLSFGRKQPLRLKVVHVGRLIDELNDLLRRSLGDGVQLECVIDDALWNTLVDPTQLEAALLNLAINARDAMQGQGRLGIEVRNVQIENGNQDMPAGDHVSIAVADTGRGMTAEVAAQAFEPFFTTKPLGEGTGLGLAMVYGFIKQSGGSIKLHSDVGRGTTVRLLLPRSLQVEHDEVVVAPAVRPAVGGNETVLVVEDNTAVRAASVDLLTGLGYRVLQAADADAALAIVQSGQAIDLLFTDVVMPGSIDSRALARKAQHLLPKLAVLFTSGYYAEAAIVHGGRLDADVELLAKPYTRDALARKVCQVLLSKRG